MYLEDDRVVQLLNDLSKLQNSNSNFKEDQAGYLATSCRRCMCLTAIECGLNLPSSQQEWLPPHFWLQCRPGCSGGL